MTKLAPFLFAILLAVGTSRAETYHGVRNEKCAASADEAKAQIIERLGADRKLCDGIGGAAQIGGWSCHAGAGGCPKKKFRCNTQYRCAHSVSVTPDDIPAPGTGSTGAAPGGTPAAPTTLPGGAFPTRPPTPFPTKPPVVATPFPTAPPIVPSPVSMPTPAAPVAPATNAAPTPAAPAPAATNLPNPTVPTPAATPVVPPNPNGGGPIPNPKLDFKPKVLTP
jgi:hypothetical protein